MKKEAVIVVDYQNDFADPERGSLYVETGEKIAPEINKIVKETKESGGIILASRELHTRGHISFASNFKGKESIIEAFKRGENPGPNNFLTKEEVQNWTENNNGLNPKAGFNIEELKAYIDTDGDQVMWPDHCVDGEYGAEYYKGFDANNVDVEIKKGFIDNTHPYSAFGGKTLDEKTNTLEILKNAGIKVVKVVGLATDYCDIATALDAIKQGFKVEFFTKASAGVDPAGTIDAINKMREAGVKIID